MKLVSDDLYPEAEMIVVVLDNLNTHTPAAFYEAFDPEEARRLTERFEFHYTPKHGSWLNMAEIELSFLTRQCLDHHIPDKEALIQGVAAWQEKRKKEVVKVLWPFTTADARINIEEPLPSDSSVWQTTRCIISIPVIGKHKQEEHDA